MRLGWELILWKSSRLIVPVGAVLFDLDHFTLPLRLTLSANQICDPPGVATFSAGVSLLAIRTIVIMRIVDQGFLPFRIELRA